MKKRLAFAAVAALSFIGVMPAEAAAPNYNESCTADPMGSEHIARGPADESLCWPQPAGPQTIVIQGGYGIWRLRSMARELDAKVGGLTFITDRGATCAAYPTNYCITVSFQNHTTGWAANYAGWFQFGPRNGIDGQIVFNSNYNNIPISQRKMVAGHELLHAVGFEHHTDIGIVGLKTYPTYSPTELRVLRGWYGE